VIEPRQFCQCRSEVTLTQPTSTAGRQGVHYLHRIVRGEASCDHRRGHGAGGVPVGSGDSHAVEWLLGGRARSSTCFLASKCVGQRRGRKCRARARAAARKLLEQTLDCTCEKSPPVAVQTSPTCLIGCPGPRRGARSGMYCTWRQPGKHSVWSRISSAMKHTWAVDVL
jgi:hypothetical protein